MADEPLSNPQADAKEQPEAPGSLSVNDRVVALLHWARASRSRMAVVGALGLTVLGGIFSVWSYLAHLAVSDEAPISLEMALEALDNRDFEEAKNLIGLMQQQPPDPNDFGGQLLVLGAVKEFQAQGEWSAARQRAMHLVAARYLQKARALEVPPEREAQLVFLLGQSLIRGNQPREGIAVLNKALRNKEMPATKLHALLAEANLALPDPDYEATLRHNAALLADPALTDEQRNDALVIRAEVLEQLGQLDEANKLLEQLQNDPSRKAVVQGLTGRFAVAAAQGLPEESPERRNLLKQALEALREAQRLDPASGELTRRAMYWIGKCYELQGDPTAAMVEYDRIGKLYSDTPESLVATLAKADLNRFSGNRSLALAGYRSVLETVGDPVTYFNPLLSMTELKKRLVSAHASFVESHEFEEALTLLEQFTLLYEQVEVIRMRGQTHEQWGFELLKNASDQPRRRAEGMAKEGRYHLRAAGRAYESLAYARFATREFTDDLWLAAEYYYLGQNYTHAARVLEEYLHYEAERRNAAALLRLGQCLLTSDKTARAIQALEQCIEMFPRDVAVYQARLECVRAYLQENRAQEAEQLLLTNLTGDALAPQSPEWRDSLFALGQLLHDTGRNREAILKLEEAVIRYPDAPQALMARYTIARSFHSAAEGPAQNVLDAKTENERQKNRRLRDQNLAGSLENYLLVQRMITLEGHGENSSLKRSLLRNCYMMQGSVLFQLRRYEEARKAYANVSTLYQNEPFVLESFVHIANCWRRLNQPIKARGTIEQAKLVLQRLPPDTDFKIATNFDKQYWQILLSEMSKW